MDEPTRTIRALIDRIESTPHDDQRVECQALGHLTRLLEGMESRKRPVIQRRITRLRDFWLQHVPWCMPLSKELEIVLIQLEESGQ